MGTFMLFCSRPAESAVHGTITAGRISVRRHLQHVVEDGDTAAEGHVRLCLPSPSIPAPLSLAVVCDSSQSGALWASDTPPPACVAFSMHARRRRPSAGGGKFSADEGSADRGWMDGLSGIVLVVALASKQMRPHRRLGHRHGCTADIVAEEGAMVAGLRTIQAPNLCESVVLMSCLCSTVVPAFRWQSSSSFETAAFSFLSEGTLLRSWGHPNSG